MCVNEKVPLSKCVHARSAPLNMEMHFLGEQKETTQFPFFVLLEHSQKIPPNILTCLLFNHFVRSLLLSFVLFLYILIKKQFSLSIFRLHFIAFVLHCRFCCCCCCVFLLAAFTHSLSLTTIRVRLSLKRHNDIKSGH